MRYVEGFVDERCNHPYLKLKRYTLALININHIHPQVNPIPINIMEISHSRSSRPLSRLHPARSRSRHAIVHQSSSLSSTFKSNAIPFVVVVNLWHSSAKRYQFHRHLSGGGYKNMVTSIYFHS